MSLVLSGCFEGFEELITSVRYDPFEQVFEVERRLVNVGERFFACTRDADCPERVLAILNGETTGEAAYAPAAQLRDRLAESGAENVAFELIPTVTGLDIVVTYEAKLGSRAAEETRVHVEFEGRGRGGRYRMVVDAQERMTMDRGRHNVRRRAQGGSGLLTWREEWVLRPRVRDVVLRNPVATSIRSVLTHDGVAEMLAERSRFTMATSSDLAVEELVEATVSLPPPASAAPAVSTAPNAQPEVTALVVGTQEEPPVIEDVHVVPLESEPLVFASQVASERSVESLTVEVVEPVVEPAVEPVVEPVAPEEVPVAVPRWDVWMFDGQPLPPVDPKGSAVTYVHEARVVGSPMPDAWREQLDLLGERSRRCYQLRSEQSEVLEGHAFLEVSLAKAEVTSTAVYGQMEDAELMRCLRQGLESWTPPATERYTQGTRWTLPVTFRIETQRRRRR